MDLGDLRKILIEELGCLEDVDTGVRKAIRAALATMVAPQICEYCGIGFERQQKQRFCSPECYQHWRDDQIPETPDRGRYSGPTPPMREIYRDAFAELDGARWAARQVADIERLREEALL